MVTRFITKGKGTGRKVIPIGDMVATVKARHLTPNYSKIETSIIKLLTEDTGSNLLDSGGAYGRNYERNQKIKDWTKESAVTFDDTGITKNLFSFLTEYLEITNDSDKLQKRYDRMMAKSDEAYLTDMEQFLETLSKKGELESDDYIVTAKPSVINTYNEDNLLSQILQYAIFFKDGQHYIILQIHNGCDARGGYTKPKIFELTEPDSFILHQTNANVTTKKGSYYTDDTYHFYDDQDTSRSKEWDELFKEGVLSVS